MNGQADMPGSAGAGRGRESGESGNGPTLRPAHEGGSAARGANDARGRNGEDSGIPCSCPLFPVADGSSADSGPAPGATCTPDSQREELPAPTPTATPAPQELRIELWAGDWVEYFGTRAGLEAEGLIPDGAAWPEGTDWERWKSGRFEYWLRRSRPLGLKGPHRLWATGDWWAFRVMLGERTPEWRRLRMIDEKRRELQRFERGPSPEQFEAEMCQFRAYLSARHDDAFRAFKEALPGWPKRRGRKPRAPA
jgi:hypothetical protein